MSQELVLTVPHTGELLELTLESSVKLAELRSEIVHLESQLRETKTLLDQELHRRMDLERQYTMHLPGGIKITGKSDALVSVWDTEQLLEVLDGMVAAGEITTEAMQRAVQPRTEYKVLAAGITALLKSPALAPRLEACRTLVEPTDRRISVGRT